MKVRAGRTVWGMMTCTVPVVASGLGGCLQCSRTAYAEFESAREFLAGLGAGIPLDAENQPRLIVNYERDSCFLLPAPIPQKLDALLDADFSRSRCFCFLLCLTMVDRCVANHAAPAVAQVIGRLAVSTERTVFIEIFVLEMAALALFLLLTLLMMAHFAPLRRVQRSVSVLLKAMDVNLAVVNFAPATGVCHLGVSFSLC